MKRTKIALAGAFLLAIGSAFVSKASDKPYQNPGFIQGATTCTAVSTPCNQTGSIACGATVYKFRTNASTCNTLLSQKNP